MLSTAKCLFCGQECSCLIQSTEGVWIKRICRCGAESRTLLYASSEFYHAAQNAAKIHHTSSKKCMVVEVTQRCNVGCHTCSASSIETGNDLSTSKLSQGIRSVSETDRLHAIAISGGEPLLHPDLPDILKIAHENADRVILITSGEGLEDNNKLDQTLQKYQGSIEVYLQFDSLNDEILRALRTDKVSAAVRMERFRRLTGNGIPVTPVCVVSPISPKEEIHELVSFAIENHARGITFQPLREVGRIPRLDLTQDRFLTVDGVQREAIAAAGSSQSATPYPSQPFDLAVNWITSSSDYPDLDFFPSSHPDTHFRIATCSYWDINNYVSRFATSNDFYFGMYTEAGMGMVPLTSYYLHSQSAKPTETIPAITVG